jgi:hypothetical protein
VWEIAKGLSNSYKNCNEDNLNQTNLDEIIADVCKKRAAISEELDVMAASPKEKKTKRYNKLIDSYDKLTKRHVDLLKQKEEENVTTQKLETLIDLVEWAHKHQQEKEEGEKRLLTTIKNFGSGKKRSLIVIKQGGASSFPPTSEAEEKELLEFLPGGKKRRPLDQRFYGELNKIGGRKQLGHYQRWQRGTKNNNNNKRELRRSEKDPR